VKLTRNLGLSYSHSSNPDLIGYSDLDYPGDRDDQKSIFGYVFILQSAAVLWKSNKQSMVTLSGTEAEYFGSLDTARDGIWLHHLLNDFIDLYKRNTVAEALETCGKISRTDLL
jgi:hypothetical protein